MIRPRGGSRSTADLRLNEVMAQNASTEVMDDAGRAIVQDWVELFNTGDAPVRLDEYSLTDDRARPTRFRFPAGLTLAPGEFRVVFVFSRAQCAPDCDESLADCLTVPEDGTPLTEDDIAGCEARFVDCKASCSPAGLVADFRLGGSERLYLFRDGQIVDEIGLNDPGADTAIGRFPDGSGALGVAYVGATPGSANPPVGVLPPQIDQTIQVGTIIPGCDDEVEVLFDVAVDTVHLDQLHVRLEYGDGSAADPPPAPCAAGADALFSSEGIDLQIVEDVEDPAIMRRDVNAIEQLVPRTRRFYRAMLPGAPCETHRRLRVVASTDPVEACRGGDLITYGDGQSLATVVVNEYVPRNAALQFQYDRQEFVSRGEADPDPATTRPDWIEIYNHGTTSVDISSFGLAGLGRWSAFTSGERPTLDPWRLIDNSVLAESMPGSFLLEPNCRFVILADRDGGDFRRTYRPVDPSLFVGREACQLSDGRGVFFYSADMGLAARRDEGEAADGFVLVDGSDRCLDIVEIRFDEVPDEFRDRSEIEPVVAQNVALGRLPAIDEPLEKGLTPGNFLCLPTPGADNTLLCEVPAQLEEVVTIWPRTPQPTDTVNIVGRVNFDLDATPDNRLVEFRYTQSLDGDEQSFTLTPGNGLELVLLDDQIDARAGSEIYEYRVEFSGLAAGTYVTFDVLAQDTTSGGDNEVAMIDAAIVEDVSFEFLVGFEPDGTQPRINEVLPSNLSVVLPPFVDIDDPEGDFTHDYVEIANPGGTTLDLSGYSLASEDLPEGTGTPIRRAREWVFPDGTTVGPGGLVTLYFGPPADPAPPGYLHVDTFNLACLTIDQRGEVLYLIAPSGAENGAHSVVDSVSWELSEIDPNDPNQQQLICVSDTSWARFCDGSSGFVAAPPSPGQRNAGVWLPPLIESGYHSSLFGDVGGCLGANATSNVHVTLLVDEQFARAADPNLTDASTLFDFGTLAMSVVLNDGDEPLQLSRPSPSFLCRGEDCEGVPDGYLRVELRTVLTPGQREVGPRVEFWVEGVDACGRVLPLETFSIGTDRGEHPDLAINELNFAAPLQESPEVPLAWVEILHLGDAAVSSTGMTLLYVPDQASMGNVRTFQLPAEIQLRPGMPQALPVDGLDTLAGKSGTLLLIDSFERGACATDAFGFDDVDLGVSQGRSPDGTGDVTILETPSPGARNSGGTEFVRGDVDESGSLNVTDMTRHLAILFQGVTDRPVCDDVLDVDDDGSIALPDAIFIGNYLFQGGAPIPLPYPEPGLDPTPDELDC